VYWFVPRRLSLTCMRHVSVGGALDNGSVWTVWVVSLAREIN